MEGTAVMISFKNSLLISAGIGIWFGAVHHGSELNIVSQRPDQFVLPNIPSMTNIAAKKQSRALVRATKIKQGQDALWAKGAGQTVASAGTKIGQVPARKDVALYVVLQFVDPSGKPINGTDVELKLLDKAKAAVGDPIRLTTQPVTVAGRTVSGAIKQDVRAFPRIMAVSLRDDSVWKIRDADQSAIALLGNEGSAIAQANSYSGLLAFNGRPSDVAGLLEPLQRGGKSKTIVVQRRFSPAPIVLERQVADVSIHGEPQTVITLGGKQVGRVAEGGNAKFTLSAWQAESGDLELSLQKKDEGGTWESTLKLPRLNRYADNLLDAPDLRLVAMNQPKISGLDVSPSSMVTGSDLQKCYGKPKKIEEFRILRETDGSKWWQYSKPNIWFKVREIAVDGKMTEAVEAVRLVGKDGGSVAGISVGDDYSELVKRCGRGSPSDDPLPLGKHSYLDGAVTFYEQDEKISWIEFHRPTLWLERPVEIKNLSGRTKLFIGRVNTDDSYESFADAPELLRSWIESMPGIEVVGSTEDADLILKTSMSEFTEKRKKFEYGDIKTGIDSEFSCSMALEASLSDARTGKAVSERSDGVMHFKSSARASFEKDVANGALILLAALVVLGLIKVSDTIKLLIVAAGILISADAGKRMGPVLDRASIRSKHIALRTCTEQLASALAEATDFRARVIQVDRSANTIQIQAGSREGVATGDEFQVYNGSAPLAARTLTGLKQEAILARVIEVKSDVSTCELVGIRSSVNNKFYERTSEDKPASISFSRRDKRPAASLIIDPSTCLPEVRRVFRILDMSAQDK